MKKKTILRLNKIVGILYTTIYFLYFLTAIESGDLEVMCGVIILSPPVMVNLATLFYLVKGTKK